MSSYIGVDREQIIQSFCETSIESQFQSVCETSLFEIELEIELEEEKSYEDFTVDRGLILVFHQYLDRENNNMQRGNI
jgi:hypothetical protein